MVLGGGAVSYERGTPVGVRRVEGWGTRVPNQGMAARVTRIQGGGFKVQGLDFRVQSEGFREARELYELGEKVGVLTEGWDERGHSR